MSADPEGEAALHRLCERLAAGAASKYDMALAARTIESLYALSTWTSATLKGMANEYE